MSKKYDLNYTHVIMLVVMALSLVAISGVYVSIDNNRLLFGKNERNLNVAYPENNKFGFYEFDVTINFTYQTYKGVSPRFFHEYTVSYPQEVLGVTTYTIIIKFLIESAFVTSIDIEAITYSGYSVNGTSITSPIYYDALNNPLQDAYIIFYGLPNV